MNDATAGAPVRCWIYRSGRRDETYLYLPEEDRFDEVPEVLMKAFGQPVFVMQLELSENRPLARVDVREVMDALADPGFFLQMPPKIESLLKPRKDDSNSTGLD